MLIKNVMTSDGGSTTTHGGHGQSFANSHSGYGRAFGMPANTSPSTGVSYQAPTSGQSVANFGGSNYFDQLRAISDANNEFNLNQVKMVNDFNAAEAQKNRDWQERMSNTAHQREVADLIKAGLNPILSAGGQGAFTGSGATASGQKAVADNIYGQGFISIVNSLIHASSAQSVANTYAAAAIYGHDKNYQGKSEFNKIYENLNSLNLGIKGVDEVVNTLLKIYKLAN